MFFFRYWLNGLQRRIRVRTALVLLMIHAGLALSLTGLYNAPRELMGDSFNYLVAGVIGLYGGILLGAGFVFWPLYQLMQKAKYLMRWREWIWDELPRLIAYLPTIIEIIRDLTQPRSSAKAQSEAPPSPAPGACHCPQCLQTGSLHR